MDASAKIQAAIDALPHATGGEWHYNPQNGEIYTDGNSLVCIRHMMHPERWEPDGVLLSTSKLLAEEVVRLRVLQPDLTKLDLKTGDVVVARIPGMGPLDPHLFVEKLSRLLPEGVRAVILTPGQELEVVKDQSAEVEGNPQDCVPDGWRRLEKGEIRGAEDKYLTAAGFWSWCEISQGREQGSENAQELCIRRITRCAP